MNEWESDAWDCERNLWERDWPAEMTAEEYLAVVAEHFTPPDSTPLALCDEMTCPSE